MPGGDGTGPMGFGPMTGRGFGPCGSGYGRRGFGGRGRGFRGRGFGRGMGRMWMDYPQYNYSEPEPMTKEDQRKILQEDLKYLENEIQAIKKKIDELK